ncbi:large subunit ribosomal protein L30e [Pancytospora philotis]|nr:large subunit ribosomal protein L30e [Pancytospora philotis]
MSKRVNKQTGLSVQLPLALRTGKYVVGFNKVIKSIIHKRSKCVVVSSNFPKMMRARLEYYCVLANHIPIKFYEGTNNELSVLSGFDFRASVISIIEPGEAEFNDIVCA